MFKSDQWRRGNRGNSYSCLQQTNEMTSGKVTALQDGFFMEVFLTDNVVAHCDMSEMYSCIFLKLLRGLLQTELKPITSC